MYVTVAICTWNRAKLLDQTLTRMRELRVPGGVGWELLVVNNKCTDDTDTVIERHTGALPIRRVFEPVPGHSNARNRALLEAAGDLILWTDDDVLVDPSWLALYVDAARCHPAASFFGGTVDPWFEVEPPRWIVRHLRSISATYAIIQFGPDTRPFGMGEGPFGANMAFRTQVLRRYPFDPFLGRVGAHLMSGDESDVIERMIRDGHSGVWVGSARVRHFIPATRLTTRYVWEFHRTSGQRAFRQLKPLTGYRMLFGAPRWAHRGYWVASIQQFIYSLCKGPRWLRAFLRSAYCRGIIDESRAQQKGPPHESSC
jgi:glycosyltransferase involved in cell wall biosynthesis